MKFKLVFKFLILFMGVLFFTSCHHSKSVVESYYTHSDSTQIVEQVHDSTVNIAPDSSSFIAKLVVDTATGRISFSAIKSKSGSYLNSPSVAINGNNLYVDCTTRAWQLFLSWKERYIKTVSKSAEKTPIYKNELSTWQNVQIWFGRAFLLLLFGLAIFFLSKYFFKK